MDRPGSIFSLLIISCICALLGACAATSPGTRVTEPVVMTTENTPWPDEYIDAIRDAINPEPEEIAHDLIRITDDYPGLYWRRFDDGDRVLMVSLVSNTSYYQDYLGRDYDTGAHNIWVSAVPELALRCQSFASEGMNTRLRQVMGLTPDAKLAAFVEFWVPAGSLFRPTPDNEITDSTAGLNLPQDVEPWYRDWFNELRSHQYFHSSRPDNAAYPWTQLGYTYDWGPSDRRGISEFVIKMHATVTVESITSIDDYCGAGE
jgi:hypothetical protein